MRKLKNPVSAYNRRAEKILGKIRRNCSSLTMCDVFNSLHELLTTDQFGWRDNNLYRYAGTLSNFGYDTMYILPPAFCNQMPTQTTLFLENDSQWITQDSLDALIRLLSLPIFYTCYLNSSHGGHIINRISNLLRSILLCAPHLSYDNAYSVYDKLMHPFTYDHNAILVYDKKDDLLRAADPTHLYMTFFRNKTLPLSETDTLNILQYPCIADAAFKNMNDIFTITDTVLYTIISKSYQNMIYYFKKRIIESTEYVDEYMNSLFTFGDTELLDEYMSRHNIVYTIEHLVHACTLLDVNLVYHIMNNKILPDKDCVDAVLSNAEKLSKFEVYDDTRKMKEAMQAIMVGIVRCNYRLSCDDIAILKKYDIKVCIDECD